MSQVDGTASLQWTTQLRPTEIRQGFADLVVSVSLPSVYA